MMGFLTKSPLEVPHKQANLHRKSKDSDAFSTRLIFRTETRIGGATHQLFAEFNSLEQLQLIIGASNDKNTHSAK
jgi:hypothetical protein